MRISFFREFFEGVFGREESLSIFAPRLTLGHDEQGPVAQLDRASHYGCEGLGFESLQGHERSLVAHATGLFCARQV